MPPTSPYTVLLFAHLRDALGVDHVVVHLPAGATLGDAMDVLCAEHEAIAELRDRLAVAIDERYAPLTTELAEGCRIALIPPVSGG